MNHSRDTDSGNLTAFIKSELVRIDAVGATSPEAPPEGVGATSAALRSASELAEGFAARSEDFLERRESGEAYRRSRNPYRVMARHALRREVAQYQKGLSNTAYLAAESGTQKIRLTVTPARVRFSFSDPLADLQSGAPAAGGGRRGVVREFSDGARDRLADRAAELQAQGHEPQVMLTLTSPANWEEIYLYDPETGECVEGGRLFKQHLDAFRKRLDRRMNALGIYFWSALWFLEFQERGAPHVHLIIFGCVISSKVRASLRSWLGRAWAGVVGNPSNIEKQKHIKSGTQTAKMKKKHFGYALKYASKMEQKTVSEGFCGVGRFWGVWNCKREAPTVLELDFSRLNEGERDFVHHLALKVLATIYPHSRDFFTSRAEKVYWALEKGLKHKFGFSVYGKEASEAAKSVFSA